MSDINYKKTSAEYTLTGQNGRTNKPVTIKLEINLEPEERKITVRGKNGKPFDFNNSDPYLVQAVNELIEEAISIAHNEPRKSNDTIN